MTHPVAIISDAYGAEQRVLISKSRAAQGGFSFYAPGWRPMLRPTVEAASAKLARHHNFVRWEA